jgi:hypothetical protein
MFYSYLPLWIILAVTDVGIPISVTVSIIGGIGGSVSIYFIMQSRRDIKIKMIENNIAALKASTNRDIAVFRLTTEKDIALINAKMESDKKAYQEGLNQHIEIVVNTLQKIENAQERCERDCDNTHKKVDNSFKDIVASADKKYDYLVDKLDEVYDIIIDQKKRIAKTQKPAKKTK